MKPAKVCFHTGMSEGVGGDLLYRKAGLPFVGSDSRGSRRHCSWLLFSLNWFPLESFSSPELRKQLLLPLVPLGTHQGGAREVLRPPAGAGSGKR